jgi:phosphate-selective porin OprO and OprP
MRCVPAVVAALVCLAIPSALAPHAVMAQTADARIEAIERQMRALQEELQRLKGELGTTNSQLQRSQEDARRSQEQARAAQEAAQRAQEQAKATQPALTFPNGRPTLSAPDGKSSLAVGGQMQFDLGTYAQSTPEGADNRMPVGGRDLGSGVNLRRGRIIMVGKFGDWSANFTPDFGGSPDGAATIIDAYINYDGIKPLTITLGYFKPWVTLQDAMSSNDFLFMERPAIVEIAKNLAGGDARASFGLRAATDDYFAAAYLTGSTYGSQGAALLNDQQTGATGRIAIRPLRGENWNVHVGASASSVFQFNQNTAAVPRQAVQLRDRPELRIDQNRLIDTGVLAADGATHYGVEFAANWRNFLLQGEYIRVDVDQPGILPELGFSGGYVEGSWVITGEPRRYNANSAAFARPRPAAPFSLSGGIGAWELAVRYSVADLDAEVRRGVAQALTGGVFGGRQEVIGTSLSWYPNDFLRFLLNYNYVDIDRLAANGVTQVGQHFHEFAARAQVAF